MNGRKLILVLSLITFATSPVLSQKQRQIPIPAHVDLHIVPLALATSNPSMRMGIEVKTKNRWSFGADVGIGGENEPVTRNLMHHDKRTGYDFRELRPEIKYYWHQWYDAAVYFGLEGIVSRTTYRTTDGMHSRSSSEQIFFESASFKKSKIGGVALVGVKGFIARKLTFDIYSGVGLARTLIGYKDVVNPVNQSYDPLPFEFENEDYYSGINHHPQFVIGMKIGLAVWRN